MTTNAKTITVPENGETVFIPLNKLKKHPKNARKTPHSEASIEQKAASIVAKSILQNLVVEPELDADGQPVVPPVMATPAVDPEEERCRAEEEAARLSNVFFQSGLRSGAPAGTTMPSLAGLGLDGQPATQDRHAAFLNGPVDRQTVASDRVAPPASSLSFRPGR